MTTMNMKNSLWLIEFYTNDSAINFAWVYAPSRSDAVKSLRDSQGRRFDCVITASEASHISPLAGDFKANTPDANLFFVGRE